MSDDKVAAELMGCFHAVRQRMEDCTIDEFMAEFGLVRNYDKPV